MSPRFERRRKQLLEDAQIRPQVYREMMERLLDFLEPYLKRLGRRKPVRKST